MLRVQGLPQRLGGKESTCSVGERHWRREFSPWVGKVPWRRKWQPAPVFLPGKFHGQRSLAGCSPRGHKGLDTAEQVVVALVVKSLPAVQECKRRRFNTWVGKIPGEGHGNPLQSSCLENPVFLNKWTGEPDGLWSMRSQRAGRD